MRSPSLDARFGTRTQPERQPRTGAEAPPVGGHPPPFEGVELAELLDLDDMPDLDDHAAEHETR